MSGHMLVGRRVTAQGNPAALARPQVQPGIPGLNASFAYMYFGKFERFDIFYIDTVF